MYLGAFLATIVTAIWNIPLTFLERVAGVFGDWSLWKLIFGASDISSFEIIYVLSSGIFMSAIGLFFALSVFPYDKYRNKIIYPLLFLLLLGFSSPVQLDIYDGSITLFSSKIIGVIIGFIFILLLLKKEGNHNCFDTIDKKLGKKKKIENKQ